MKILCNDLEVYKYTQVYFEGGSFQWNMGNSCVSSQMRFESWTSFLYCGNESETSSWPHSIWELFAVNNLRASYLAVMKVSWKKLLSNHYHPFWIPSDVDIFFAVLECGDTYLEFTLRLSIPTCYNSLQTLERHFSNAFGI